MFSFQTKETLWFNLKHMVGYLMALCSDCKGGRGGMVGKGDGQREGSGTEKKKFIDEISQIIVAIIRTYKKGK